MIQQPALTTQPKLVERKDLGVIDYKKAWDYQQELVNELIDRKTQNKRLAEAGQPLIPLKHYFLFCEHPHVYTLGRNGSADNLLLTPEGLDMIEASFYRINRGGDITYHGFGQVVGYPIFDLDGFFTDIGKFVRYVEEAAIRTCAEYGIKADRIPGSSGVWLDHDRPIARKICAIGIHLSRWVSMHGFAFNVNTDLEYFSHIIPCGITDKGVTSLQKELGHPVEMAEVRDKLYRHYCDLFEID